MPVTYPITLPFSVRSASSIKITQATVSGAQESPFSKVENVQVGTGQKWQADITLPPMRRDTGAPEWFAALVSLNGPEGTFYLGDTAFTAPRGVATGTPVVNGAGQSGYDLATRGWTASTANIMRAGDWLQVGTGISARLYMVMIDAASDASGDATLTLWPKIRQSPSAPADGASIVTSSPVGVFRLTAAAPWQIDNRRLITGLTFSAIEALNP